MLLPKLLESPSVYLSTFVCLRHINAIVIGRIQKL